MEDIHTIGVKILTLANNKYKIGLVNSIT